MTDRFRSATIQVEGLRESMAVLRAADKTLPRAAAKAIKTVVQRRTLPAAHRNMQAQPIPKRRGMITAFATQREAGLTMRAGSGSRYPWAHGGEYGSLTYRQFRPWLGNQHTSGGASVVGYMVGAAIEDTKENVVRELVNEITDALRTQGYTSG